MTMMAVPAGPNGRSLSERSLYLPSEPGIAAVQDATTRNETTHRWRSALRLSIEGDVPEWLFRVIGRLNHLFALSYNWDAEGAEAISQTAAEWAVRLIAAAARIGTPEPDVVPDVDGGLQVEWHVQGIDLEIATRSPGRFDVLFEDHRTGADWEAESGLGSPEIIEPLTTLAHRG